MCSLSDDGYSVIFVSPTLTVQNILLKNVLLDGIFAGFRRCTNINQNEMVAKKQLTGLVLNDMRLERN